MSNIHKLARLKYLLLGMERDLRLDELGVVQKNLVYAATLLSEKSSSFTTEDLRHHELLNDISRSVFFRALKDAVEAGYLEHSAGRQRSVYVLSKQIDELI